MACLGENTVTELVEALLAPDRRSAVEAHTAECDSCRRLLSELVRRSGPQLDARPSTAEVDLWLATDTRIGRYVVREKIGSGAMGAVFAAYDPELDRPIALKLLHPAHAQHERIQREARALARLSHPNVVAAFDAGAFEGVLFIAMELVDGTNLRRWATEPRSVDEVLDVYRQVGRGLAAAHTAGIVHRDVKPENALLGKDGRVRVVDFGLAGGRDGGTELVGTPAYMAPEQFEAGGADVASDQFAFCIALHEALHGARPFAVNLVEDVARGPARAATDRAVPAYVTDALAQGLHVDPRRRHPSMAALLTALTPPQRRVRRRVLVAGAVGGSLALLAAIAGARWSGSVAPLCRDSPAAFAAIWNPARRGELHSRFTATGVPFAEDSWLAVERGFEGFGKRWTATRTEACEATRVRGVQSDQILTLRSRCLDRGLAEADALVATLGSVDPSSIAGAPAALDGLPALDECSNLTALLAPVPPPTGKDAGAVVAIEAELARGRALQDAGRWVEAVRIATAVVEQAQVIAHQPTRAAALFLLGEAHAGAAAPKDAERVLRDAYAAAETGRDDLLAARTATELVYVVGQQQTRFGDGLEWAFHADTALRRAGGDPEIEARLAGSLGHIRYGQGDYPAARTHYQRALELRTRHHGPESRLTAKATFNLGRAVMAHGDNPGGLALMATSVTMLEHDLGAKHPDVAIALNGLGAVQLNQGNLTEALASFDRALAIAVPALGADHPRVGEAWISRGYALEGLGRNGEAMAAHRSAMAIFEHEGGDRRLLANAISGIGGAQRALGETTAALASFERALAVFVALVGDGGEDVATTLEHRGGVLLDLARNREALADYRRALAIREKLAGPDYFENAFAHAGIGEAELRIGRPEAAVPSLRKAVALLETYDGDPVTLASHRFLLAKALWSTPGDRAEARALVDTAERTLADAGPRDVKLRDELRAWKQRAR